MTIKRETVALDDNDNALRRTGLKPFPGSAGRFRCISGGLYHDAALASAADLCGADRLAEVSSASSVVSAPRSAVGVGKVGESRLVDAEIAGAG